MTELMANTGSRFRSACVAAMLGAGLTACGSQVAAPIDYRGTDPAVTATSPTPAPDNRGIVKIDNYDAVVAREGDTMETIAARVGISASELAAYNGYPAGFAPRGGDILVLPPRPGGYGAAPQTQVAASTPSAASPAASYPTSTTTERWSPALAAAAIERGGVEAGDPATASSTDAAGQSGTSDLFAPLAEPIESDTLSGPTRYRPTGNETTHIASSGDTMYSVANRYSLTVGELAYANGMQAGDAISPGQVLIIPQLAGYTSVPGGSSSVAAANSPLSEPLPSSSITTSSSGDIIIDDAGNARQGATTEQIAAASPAIEPAPVDTGAQFLSPVSGPITESYTPSRGGVELGAAPGTPVRSAESGTVVLVSKSLGGLGVIVLIRHDEKYMTVYGRVSNVAVAKGEKVSRGQVIASVATPSAGTESTMHFEIRRGTVSVDPEPLI